MKKDIRKLLCVMSATATLATMTSFFTGCSDKKNEDSGGDDTPKVEEIVYEKVDENNVSEMTQKKDSRSSNSNLGKFAFKLAKDIKAELLKGATDSRSVIFDEFKIYQNKDGEYFIIDKDKAYNLVKSGDEYKLLDKEDSHFVLTGETGNRYLVFGGKTALEAFTKELESKVKEDKVYTIVNGIFVGDTIDSKEISRFDGVRNYYDFESVLKNVQSAVEDGGYADPITYVIEKDCIKVTRTIYTTDGLGNGTGSSEMEIEIPLGDESEVYMDSKVNAFLGMTFKKDNKYWICADTLSAVLGIDITDGEYAVPGTKTTVDALMLDTTGTDEPKFVIQPSIKENENPEVTTNEEGVYDNSNNGTFTIEESPIVIEYADEPYMPGTGTGVTEQPIPDDVVTYDNDVYQKLGIKVELYGDNAQQAQQYYDAVTAAHPSLPWGNGGNNVSVDFTSKVAEAQEEADNTSVEEVTNKLNDILAGRDYHDLSIEELYDITGYAAIAARGDILSYFSEQTSKQFNAGGWIA